MRHLVSIRDLSLENIHALVDKALSTREDSCPTREGEPVGLIFLEASSRTRVSFECAAHQLRANPILVQESGSSMEKNESLKDTLLIFRSMGIKVFVIRCKSEDQLQGLTQISGVHIINGGDGKREHPTQALLDLTTMRSLYKWEELKGKKLSIVGDLKSSRVAQSWSHLAPMIGIKLKLVAPKEWKPATWGEDCVFSDSLEEGMADADFVMSLRVQKERHNHADALVTEDFVRNFQITEARLPPKALLMHPGPTNWGVELEAGLQSHARSLILLQVKYGVDLRRAVLSEIFESMPPQGTSY